MSEIRDISQVASERLLPWNRDEATAYSDNRAVVGRDNFDTSPITALMSTSSMHGAFAKAPFIDAEYMEVPDPVSLPAGGAGHLRLRAYLQKPEIPPGVLVDLHV